MKTPSSRRPWRAITGVIGLICACVVLVATFATMHHVAAAASTVSTLGIRQISSDPYTNFATQHQTQVEPSSFAYGDTLVTAFQSGRGLAAGSSNIGWATSLDKGKTWKTGFLTGITVNAGGSYRRASDSVVAYDAAHKTWIITSLGVPFSGSYDVLANRSTDGGLTWDAATPVALNGSNNAFDKDWVTCDNTATSPYYGHCYAEWDDAAQGGLVLMSTSTDGGKTWSAPNGPLGQTFAGIGGQPLTQPSGKVIVPIYGADNTTGAGGVYSFASTDGGKKWTTPVLVSSVVGHDSTSDYRGGILPSATMDAAGKVYVVWSDCSFEDSCTADDIVLSTSSDGTTWTPIQRIPLDAIGSGIDHFTAAITVAPGTSGATAHLALTFYQFANTNCFAFDCQLTARFASSVNGGATWSANTQLGQPLQLIWLADTDSGFMTGDYIAISMIGNNAFPFIAAAIAPSGGHLNEATYTVNGTGILVTGGTLSSKNEHPVTKATTTPGKTKKPLPPSN